MANNKSTMLAAVAGAVVGAVAGAILSNEDSRKKIANTAKKVGREGGRYVEDFQATAHEITKGAGDKVEKKISSARGKKSKK